MQNVVIDSPLLLTEKRSLKRTFDEDIIAFIRDRWGELYSILIKEDRLNYFVDLCFREELLTSLIQRKLFPDMMVL